MFNIGDKVLGDFTDPAYRLEEDEAPLGWIPGVVLYTPDMPGMTPDGYVVRFTCPDGETFACDMWEPDLKKA